MKTFIIAAAACAICLAPGAPVARAQWFKKPTIYVPVQHPPSLGRSLAGKKVAFGPTAGGACADQFANQLMQDFQAQGAQLIERGNLAGVLSEHNFQLSGYVDPATAVQLGKLLGPALMVFVRVTRCDHQQQNLTAHDFLNNAIYYSQTQAFLSASVRIVDLATGQDLGITTPSVSPKKQNASWQGYPEFPTVPEVMDAAVRAAAMQVTNNYFPWTSNEGVDFLDDDDCNLKEAYRTLKAGDVQGALQQSQANVQTCQTDKNAKHREHAYYDLGIMQLLTGSYKQALASLNQAESFHHDGRNIDAISAVRVAQAQAQTLKRTQAAAAAAAAAAQRQAAAQQQQVASRTLDNATIVKLVKGGLSDDVILKMIAAEPGSFTVSPDAVLELKQSGVSDAVIAAMLSKKN